MQTRSPEYETHLLSPEWRETVGAAIDRQDGLCAGCDRDVRLFGHHLSYARLGYEAWYDVLALCAECHEQADILRQQVRRRRDHDFQGFAQEVRDWAVGRAVGDTWLEWFYWWTIDRLANR